MEEVVNQSLNEEVAPLETENQESPQVQAKETIAEKPKEDSQQKNWRELNRAKKELERKLREQQELNEKLMQYVAPPHRAQQVEEPEEPDDDFISKGKVKKVAKKTVEPLEKKIEELESRLEQQRQYNQFSTLKQKYPDFDEVVNPDTLALLEENEPELAQTIADLKDPYKVGMQSYKYIKSLKLANSQIVAESRSAKEIEKKIEKNSKTVQSPQAFDKRPMAQAFRMTDAMKQELFREMMGYAALADSVPELS
jgi:hypothetical protein